MTRTDSIVRPNKEWLLTVFRGEIPDRVPNFEVLVENPTFSHVMEIEMPLGTLWRTSILRNT